MLNETQTPGGRAGAVELMPDLSPELMLFLRGTLTTVCDARWGATEVRLWLDGQRPLERYAAESKRLLGVLETRLGGRDWIMDDYSIADVATLGWVRNLIGFYEAGPLVRIDEFPAVLRVLDAFLARPAVTKGLTIPAASSN